MTMMMCLFSRKRKRLVSTTLSYYDCNHNNDNNDNDVTTLPIIIPNTSTDTIRTNNNISSATTTSKNRRRRNKKARCSSSTTTTATNIITTKTIISIFVASIFFVIITILLLMSLNNNSDRQQQQHNQQQRRLNDDNNNVINYTNPYFHGGCIAHKQRQWEQQQQQQQQQHGDDNDNTTTSFNMNSNNIQRYINLIGNQSNYYKRVCSSMDDELLDYGNIDINYNYCKRLISNNIWNNYIEIRFMGNNWESIFFETWILQIILNEILNVPTSVDLGVFNKSINFYDPYNRFDYGKAYDWDAFRTAQNVNDCRNIVKQNYNNFNSNNNETYISCAHVTLEVWESQTNILDTLYHEEQIIERVSNLGLLGTDGWWIPKYTAQYDSSLLSYIGLIGEKNRKKLAETFLRPTTWYEYCNEVSTTNCTIPDQYAKRSPINDSTTTNEYNRMFYLNEYTGYFRKTIENDCILYPNNCTGHIVDFPCGWSSFIQQQTYWLNISLKSSGIEPICNGYSYQQMNDIWHAANATKSHVIMNYWTPESLVLLYSNTNYEFQRVSLPSPTQSCLNNRIKSIDRCQDNITLRIGNSEGSCDVQTQILHKVITKNLYDLSYNNMNNQNQNNNNRNSNNNNNAVRSPAYDTIQNFQITSLQLGMIFEQWLSGIDPREAVCDWVIDNYETVVSFIPTTFPRTLSSESNEIPFYKIPMFYISFIVSICVMILLLYVGYYIYIRRKRKAMIIAQVEFLLLLIIGLIFVQIGSLSLSLPTLSNSSCIVPIWFINVGYTFELVPIVVKITALNRLMIAARQMRRLQIKRNKLFYIVFIFVFLILLYCTIWTIIDPPNLMNQYTLLISSSSTSTTAPSDDTVTDNNINNNDMTYVMMYSYCTTQNRYWILISYLWRTILLMWTTVLAYQTRNSPVNFNESKSLGKMIYSQFLFLLWQLALFIIQGILEDSSSMSTSSSISLSTNLARYQSLLYSFDVLAVCILYFIPKLNTPDSSFRNLRNRLSGIVTSNRSSTIGGSHGFISSSGFADNTSRASTITPDNRRYHQHDDDDDDETTSSGRIISNNNANQGSSNRLLMNDQSLNLQPSIHNHQNNTGSATKQVMMMFNASSSSSSSSSFVVDDENTIDDDDEEEIKEEIDVEDATNLIDNNNNISMDSDNNVKKIQNSKRRPSRLSRRRKRRQRGRDNCNDDLRPKVSYFEINDNNFVTCTIRYRHNRIRQDDDVNNNNDHHSINHRQHVTIKGYGQWNKTNNNNNDDDNNEDDQIGQLLPNNRQHRFQQEQQQQQPMIGMNPNTIVTSTSSVIPRIANGRIHQNHRHDHHHHHHCNNNTINRNALPSRSSTEPSTASEIDIPFYDNDDDDEVHQHIQQQQMEESVVIVFEPNNVIEEQNDDHQEQNDDKDEEQSKEGKEPQQQDMVVGVRVVEEVEEQQQQQQLNDGQREISHDVHQQENQVRLGQNSRPTKRGVSFTLPSSNKN